MLATERIETHDWAQNTKHANVRDLMLLKPTASQLVKAEAFVEQIKEEFPDLVGECYTTDCPPGMGFTAFTFSVSGKCNNCAIGVTFNAYTDSLPCTDVTSSCPPGQGYALSTSM